MNLPQEITSGTTVQSLDNFSDDIMEDIIDDDIVDEVQETQVPQAQDTPSAPKRTRTTSVTPEERAIMDRLEVLGDLPKSKANNEEKSLLVKQLKPLRSVRLANMRITAALQKLALVENLTGAQYTYTQDQKNCMIAVLSDAVCKIQAKFDGMKDTANKFSL